MSGKAAAFGARMMTSVADQVLKQFGDNFAAQVAVLEGERTAAMPKDDAPLAASQPAASASGASASASSPPAGRELNGLALAWQALKDWLRGLFSKSAA
jgi:hypothetical protein